MNPSTTRKTTDASDDGRRADPRPSATVVPMPVPAGRRFRREADDGAEPRGRILFFTGVRYERLPEDDAPPLPQRRRS